MSAIDRMEARPVSSTIQLLCLKQRRHRLPYPTGLLPARDQARFLYKIMTILTAKIGGNLKNSAKQIGKKTRSAVQRKRRLVSSRRRKKKPER